MNSTREDSQVTRMIVDREGMATEFLAQLTRGGTQRGHDLANQSVSRPHLVRRRRNLCAVEHGYPRAGHSGSGSGSHHLAPRRPSRRARCAYRWRSSAICAGRVPVRPDPEEARDPRRWDSDLPPG